MKLIKSALIGSLALFLLSSAALALENSANFTLNQPAQLVDLEQQEFETIYRTEQVPDTCYRDEVQGSRRECHTEYDRRCSYDNYPVCTTVPRNFCTPSQQCTTQMDRVCNSRGCTNVPRRVCQTVNHCSTRYEQVCRTETRQICENYPRQACVDIPIVVSVPYSCTRTVQVPAGQRLKLKTIANVNVQLANFNEVGPTADILTASLSSGIVTITAPQQSAFLYQIVSQQRSEQMISSTEKVVTYHIQMRARSIQQLNEFLNSQIVNPVLYKNRIEFIFAGKLDVPIKGRLEISRARRVLSPVGIASSEFANAAIINQGGNSILTLSHFGIDQLEQKYHYIKLSLSLDLQALQQGLVNADVLCKLATRSVEAQFEGFPK